MSSASDQTLAQARPREAATRAAPPPGGWQLLALGSELAAPVTGLALGSRALVAIRMNEGGEAGRGAVRVFDGTCPHRGAHLGFGGRVTGPQSITCPFHGKRIGLGAGSGRLCVREHETIDAGGAVFVRLGDVPAPDYGFEAVLANLSESHEIVAAVAGPVGVPPELIIENAFDFSHFPTVHLIPRVDRPKVWLGDSGELNLMTAFHTRAPDWEAADGEFTSHFHARAFNPSLVVSELGSGESAKFVITGAVPAGAGCVARIALAVRRGEAEATVSALVDGSRIAFEEDLLVWNHLDLAAPAQLDSADTPVLAFRAFCASFRSAAARPPDRASRPGPAPMAAAGR
jgi:nitrite reductase/ring-hydroxylating ferredoxin subunit